MTLSEYIQKHGDEALAKVWGVKPRTVASWRRGERVPRYSQACQIVETSDGEVSYQDIYGQVQRAA
jgi:hypothetical protein